MFVVVVAVDLTPCQVPRARRPFVMGIVRETPMRLDLTCPGMSYDAAKEDFSMSDGMIQLYCEDCTVLIPTIIPFHGMAEHTISIPFRRYNFVECCFHVCSNVGVRIFVNGEACRSMLDKDIAHPDGKFLNIRSSSL
jgi:hypothetical protein